MQLSSVCIPERYLEILETFVSEGRFPNRSEAIRVAIRDLIKKEYLLDEILKKSQIPKVKT
jgi:antitoxin ParD1/3/4